MSQWPAAAAASVAAPLKTRFGSPPRDPPSLVRPPRHATVLLHGAHTFAFHSRLLQAPAWKYRAKLRMITTLLRSRKLCLPSHSIAGSRSLSHKASAQSSLGTSKAEYPGHVPVLLEHVLSILNPVAGERVVDCTAGLGGHASAIARRLGATGSITLLDADAANLRVAAERVQSSTAVGGPPITLHHMNFRHLASVVAPGSADIVIADLGLCSTQIDNLCRGFSFRTHTKGASAHPLANVDAPLDMRFDQSPTSPCMTVSDWLQRTKPFDVANALVKFGEVRPSAARRIASAIQENLPVTSTKQLRDIVVQQTGEVQPPLAQVFQALRMVVNDELSALGDLLRDGTAALAPGGRLAVISFHSLEDRAVKTHFRVCSADTQHPVTGQITRVAPFELLTKRAVQAGQDEVTANVRARSARLRVLLRTLS